MHPDPGAATGPAETVASPPAGRKAPVTYLVVLLAVAVVIGAVLALRMARTDAPATGRFLVLQDEGGIQSNAFGEGEYGYIGTVEVLAANVAIRSLVPVDANGREVPHRVAVVDRDRVSAQAQLYLTRSPATEPVRATTGDRLELALRIRPACPDAAPVTAVRFHLEVDGRAAEQVVPITGRHGEFHAERTREMCS